VSKLITYQLIGFLIPKSELAVGPFPDPEVVNVAIVHDDQGVGELHGVLVAESHQEGPVLTHTPAQ